MQPVTTFILETARDLSHGGPYRFKNVQTTPPPPIQLLFAKASQSDFSLSRYFIFVHSNFVWNITSFFQDAVSLKKY